LVFVEIYSLFVCYIFNYSDMFVCTHYLTVYTKK